MTQMDYQDKEAVLARVAEQLSDYSFLESKGVLHEYSDSSLIPSAKVLRELVELCRAVFFPGFYDGDGSLGRIHELMAGQIASGLYMDERPKHGEACKDTVRAEADAIATLVVKRLPEVKALLETDVDAIAHNDPAVKSLQEIVFCYPAVTAMIYYRTAHELYRLGVPVIPRMLTEHAHSVTGIDIHPGAVIGDHFAIDHGTGIVIGETSIIGSHVTLYQGVTLGARNFSYDKDGNPINLPRHPILEDGVTVYSNASILGRVTIGKDSVIGGNVWLTRSVPEKSRILQGKTQDFAFSDGAGI